MWIKRAFLVLFIAALVAVFAWLLWPQPVPVEAARVVRGHMEATVDEEGVNRVRDVYVVSAPVSGRVERNPHLVGDHVTAGQTIVAVIRPADPTILDVRTRLELERAVEAAKAALDSAAAEVRRAQAGNSFAGATLARTVALARRGVVATSALEKAQMEAETASQQLATATAELDRRRHDLEAAEARLAPSELPDNPSPGACCITLKAPVSGVILKLPQVSERLLPAGTPLVEIGNPLAVEIAVDLLSTDAVKVKPGALARITGWGGDGELKAQVRRVDPAAFTKISALGIEEQRVEVVLDLLDPPAQWTGLGHEFRVFVHIVVWQSDNALQVPLSALVRSGAQWAVFKIVDGVARLTPVEVGQMNIGNAQILRGLSEADVVIVHPSDAIGDGTAVATR